MRCPSPVPIPLSTRVMRWCAREWMALLFRRGSTGDMIKSVPELISYVSSIFTLLPGDVILTGTPAGVGEIRAGQRVEVEVEGIGSFSNPVMRR